MNSNRVTFNGSHYLTICRAAEAFACDAMPDASEVSATEDARMCAADLEAFWYREALASQGRLDLPVEGDESVDEADWRDACVNAIEARIVEYRASVRFGEGSS